MHYMMFQPRASAGAETYPVKIFLVGKYKCQKPHTVSLVMGIRTITAEKSKRFSHMYLIVNQKTNVLLRRIGFITHFKHLQGSNVRVSVVSLTSPARPLESSGDVAGDSTPL